MSAYNQQEISIVQADDSESRSLNVFGKTDGF